VVKISTDREKPIRNEHLILKGIRQSFGLQHASIIETEDDLVDVVRSNGVKVNGMVMKKGITLQKIIDQKKREKGYHEWAGVVLRKVFEVLVELEARGYYHCDINTDNIIFLPENQPDFNQPVIIDFGNARGPDSRETKESLSQKNSGYFATLIVDMINPKNWHKYTGSTFKDLGDFILENNLFSIS